MKRKSWQTTLGGILLGIGTPLAATGEGAYQVIGVILSSVGALILGTAARDHKVSSKAAGVTTWCLLLACLMLAGCATGIHKTETAWVKQSTYAPTSLIEYIDGDAENGVDLGAVLAADFSADMVKLTRTDGTVTMTIEAEGVGAMRSNVMRELPEILRANAEQLAQVRAGLADLVEIIARMAVPVP